MGAFNWCRLPGIIPCFANAFVGGPHGNRKRNPHIAFDAIESEIAIPSMIHVRLIMFEWDGEALLRRRPCQLCKS